MSRPLARLLGADENDVAALVMGLEKLAGHPAIDVHLVLEIEKVAAERSSQLGLDPADTTAQELYHTLLARFEQDENRFVRTLGATGRHGHEALLPLIIKKLAKADMPRSCWALKHTTAKALLKACPPKATMKHLNYRTLDSLLKRESVEEILAAAPFLETSGWGQRFTKQCARLKAGDFEHRPIEIIAMSTKLYADLPNRGAIVGYVPLVGAVAVWPARLSVSRGLVLAVLVLQAMQSLRLSSSWLEFSQMSPDFSKLVADVLAGQPASAGRLAGQPVSWQNLVYHYGQIPRKKLPPQFERLHTEGFDLLIPEAVLRQLQPDLRWWLGLNYIGQSKDRTISFNLVDVAINSANQISHQAATANSLNQAVKDELISRYLRNEWVEDALLSQLEETSRV